VTSIQLPANLDLGGAAALAVQLLEARGSELALDASGVQRLTGIGLEVLIAAQKQWRSDGCAFSVSGWTDPVLQTLQTLGAVPAYLSEGG
jgi:chemotaxis protein CheX